MYSVLRKLLFSTDAETAHHTTLSMLKTAPNMGKWLRPKAQQPAPNLATQLYHMDLKHPIGLAAGLDKDGIALTGLEACGFSMLEVGTVTLRPQPGNPKPRLFRIVEEEALVNRMGFNNAGAHALKKRLQESHLTIPVGANIGKNKITPNAQAVDDYVACTEILAGVADYLVINVSSPNTPGLRDLQNEQEASRIVEQVIAERNRQTSHRSYQPPVFVKLSPDLPDESLVPLASKLLEAGCEGWIATNTTLERYQIKHIHARESGGLSGKPLKTRSNQVIAALYKVTEGKVPIIGCGGIYSADDVYEKIKLGASVVQIYSAFIYRGPALLDVLTQELAERLDREGVQRIADLVGQAESYK
ncbi:quinone-dependent dihydroorotate dehydrogenase [Alicyclobacillus tolerans]|uniref:Dihydroorotate dehydrogenase (quinone) n=1 Tax=Alicyclobacillus tolerans TaxID=90970 RepID=A0ABT9LTJ2_9BACL|nr:quinone-dependent dihydroorotate dehydrogenase [Alicyclobacillus tengchongensis]MDP9727585.1 dihydroorotate dehydrogenase [Alicyclobacillus tengchongensis]